MQIKLIYGKLKLVSNATNLGETLEKESLGKYIAGIYRNSQCIINKKFEGYDIGSGQHDFLYIISNNQGISQKELSQKLHIGKATTAKTVKHLEKKVM